jgi:hypothetical protein
LPVPGNRLRQIFSALAYLSPVREVERVVAEQLEYYRARAEEYDQYYERTGFFVYGTASAS